VRPLLLWLPRLLLPALLRLLPVLLPKQRRLPAQELLPPGSVCLGHQRLQLLLRGAGQALQEAAAASHPQRPPI
jgi:hypothetical protein